MSKQSCGCSTAKPSTQNQKTSTKIQPTTWSTGNTELKDHILARLGINRQNHTVTPGLYSLGQPQPQLTRLCHRKLYPELRCPAIFTKKQRRLHSSPGHNGRQRLVRSRQRNLWHRRVSKQNRNHRFSRCCLASKANSATTRRLRRQQL